MVIEEVQHFLLDLTAGQNISPFVFLTLAFEKSQVMPEFPQNGLGLIANRLNQAFLRAHIIKEYCPAFPAGGFHSWRLTDPHPVQHDAQIRRRMLTLESWN